MPDFHGSLQIPLKSLRLPSGRIAHPVRRGILRTFLFHLSELTRKEFGGEVINHIPAFQFHRTTQADSRSIANVTFRTGDAELDAAFVAGAAEHQIQNVKGHRLVGGMRASVYNAVTMEDVQALATYMKDFEAQHGLSQRSN